MKLYDQQKLTHTVQELQQLQFSQKQKKTQDASNVKSQQNTHSVTIVERTYQMPISIIDIRFVKFKRNYCNQ